MNNIQFITHENKRFGYVEGAEMAKARKDETIWPCTK